jgi:hypothetical protein
VNVLALAQRTHLLIGLGSRGNTAKPGTVPTALTGQTDELAELVEWILMALTNFQTMFKWGWLIRQGTLAFSSGTATKAASTITEPAGITAGYRDWIPFKQGGRRYVLRYLTADGPTSTNIPVYFMEYADFRGLRDRSPVATGAPMYFTIHPSQLWEVYPTPDANYTLKLDYLCAPKIYTTSDGTTKIEDYPGAANSAAGLPVEFHEAIAWLAIRYWAESRGKLDTFQIAERRFDELTRPLKARYLPTARI